MKLFKQAFLVVFAAAVLLMLPKGVHAQTINTLSSKTDVASDKVWTVKFSEKADMTTINSKNILVYDSNSNPVNVTVSYDMDSNAAIVSPPSTGYEAGKTYTIKVTDGVKSAAGKVLSAITIMNFTIKNAVTPIPQPAKTYTIVVDPGHGGYDSGAVGPAGIKEKDVTLAIGLKVGAILAKNNVNVIYTRTSDNVSWPADVNKDLQARCDIANNANADLFISIHMNSYDDASVNGTETYYFPGSTKGQALAQSIQSQLVSALGTTDRGIKTASYYVLKYTNAPAVLTEVGFISNPTEEQELNDNSFQDEAAQAIADGILKYIGLK